MSKRLLMIADANGFWTKRYIEHLLLPAGYEVVLFPIWGNKGTFDDFYEASGVTVYRDNHTLPLVRHIPRLRMWVRVWLNAFSLRKLGPFHVIHNHYLSRRDLALAGAVRRFFPKAKWVCSFWGSDLLRSSGKQHAGMRPYLRRADAITIHSALQFGDIRRHYGETLEKKTALVYFGQTVYEDIDRVRSVIDKAQCKRHFGIDPARRVVCVGYNAAAAQHQPEILRALKELPSALHANLTVILQMTYGASDGAYLQAVEEARRALPAETLLYTEFMDATESAYLRLAADAFILAIQTDAFSASLQEYLYAGARVLRGDWLSYPQLDELGIETIPFSDYPEIPALLERALAAPMAEDEMARRMELRARYSWDAVREGWLRLY